jgi:hypothetical protein
MSLVQRARGALLRLVRRRPASALVGALLVVPAAWVEFGTQDFPAWSQGIALIAGAVGVALLWTGIAGLAPDWIDRD